jgi:hypothetical protein
MKKLFVSLLLGLVASGVHAKQEDVLVNQACIQNGVQVCRLVSMKREQLENGIAHYEIELKVGTGQYDVIALHRVIREQTPGVQPVNAKPTFLVHGDVYGFKSFISSVNSNVVDHSHSIGIVMAMAGMDVWGMDLRWIRIKPFAVNQSFAFMRDWGLSVAVKDMDVAVNAARNLRRLQGSANAQFSMLGWSRGGQLGYLYLAKEAQRSAATRNIKSFIPVDILVKTNDETIRQGTCDYAEQLRSQWLSGQYADETGLVSQQMALLAQTLPDQPSPFVPGMTNKQAVLLLLTSTYVLTPPGGAYTPFYHYNAGKFDESGMPVNLAFANLKYLYEYATGLSPYEPVKFLAEATDLTCNSPYGVLGSDLSRIYVPMLYVGAAGGIGKAGEYTMKLTSHPDKTSFIVKTLPNEQAALDYGHVDLFTATDANTRVWRNIIVWMQRH